MLPESENKHSEVALLAGTTRYFFASAARLGRISSCDFHHKSSDDPGIFMSTKGMLSYMLSSWCRGFSSCSVGPFLLAFFTRACEALAESDEVLDAMESFKDLS